MITTSDFLLYQSEFLRTWERRGYGRVGRFESPLLTWDGAINIVDDHIRMQAELGNRKKVMQIFPNGGCACTKCDDYPIVNPLQTMVREFAEQNVPVQHGVSSHLYASLSGVSATHGVHDDPLLDVFIWQHIGNIAYVIDQKEIVHLRPGDVLYISRGIVHEPIVTMPRVTISTAIEYTDGI